MSKKFDAEKAKTLQEHHAWLTCMALKEAFDARKGHNGVSPLNWAAICQAAYHAGAAKGIYDIRFFAD